MLRYTEGWPADEGPLQSLHKVGLLSHPGHRPEWLHYPTTDTDKNGVKTYNAKTRFMSNLAIRSLAALTFEGWDVFVNQTPEGLSIRVKSST